MTILKIDLLFTWTHAKSLEDDKWRLPEIDELYKIYELGILEDGKYYWSNTPSDVDKNWKKGLSTVQKENRCPRELEGYKEKPTFGKLILIKKNQK